MTFLQRVATKPGYKILSVVFTIIACFYILCLTQPVVEVNEDNMVVSVDGKPTFRPIMNWDLREAKIVRVKDR